MFDTHAAAARSVRLAIPETGAKGLLISPQAAAPTSGPEFALITGTAGNDSLRGMPGVADTINGGAGEDLVDYFGATPAGVFVNLANQVAQNDGGGAVDILQNIENVIGTEFNDTIIGSAGNNVLQGFGGRDYLIGGAGRDRLLGGADLIPDHLQGGAGDDLYEVEVGDTITEFADEGVDQVRTGADFFVLPANVEELLFFPTNVDANVTAIGNARDNLIRTSQGEDSLYGAAGLDYLDGRAGQDTADYSRAASGVNVDLSVGLALSDGDGDADVLISIENLVGSRFDDLLTGDAGDNILQGGAGADTLVGGASGDTLDGGAGVDRVDYSAATAGINIVLGSGGSDGEGGIDVVLAIENVVGGSFGDTIIGDEAANNLQGGLGRDQLVGGDGNDTLIGGDGDANQLQGGAGDDTYILTANDTVVELADGGFDRVQTSLNFANLAPNVEQVSFTGTGNFTGFGNAGANTIVGGALNDVLAGRGGNDNLFGGSGIDTAVLLGLQADYTITPLAGGRFTITDTVAGRDGTDTLDGVEQIRFFNGVVLTLGPAPAAEVSAKATEPQVLPELSDDPFLLTGDINLPQVLPAIEADDGSPAPVLGLTQVWTPDHMLTIDGGGMLVADVEHQGGMPHDDWLT
ncbi:calcium-binding protein [Brevundimonas sp. Root1279]|uniref:calcium-binding protein n=1 Tax=Brevundimonas sp. Root1279 TaxID=1736443 RepID=UPI0006FAB5F4|nr:calcium-binding protein [Brevundimonas sp. Root1279]KQW82959.1 hypothetical protein ASC65_06325 [Brevundimonas sp. Root1279]